MKWTCRLMAVMNTTRGRAPRRRGRRLEGRAGHRRGVTGAAREEAFGATGRVEAEEEIRGGLSRDHRVSAVLKLRHARVVRWRPARAYLAAGTAADSRRRGRGAGRHHRAATWARRHSGDGEEDGGGTRAAAAEAVKVGGEDRAGFRLGK